MSFRDIAKNAPKTFRRNRVRLVRVDRAEDLIDLVAASSPESRFLRFHTGMAALRPSMAEYLASTPAWGLRNWRGRLVAEARYTPTSDTEAEAAILVSDKYQGRGLGKALLAVVFAKAADEGIQVITADILNSNDAVIALLSQMAPMETVGFAEGARKVRILLDRTPVTA